MIKKEDTSKDILMKVDILDVLLDENNNENIVIMDNKGNLLEMEQIAVIPYGAGNLYAILKPVTKSDIVGEDEAIVFKVVRKENGKSDIEVEEDENKARAVFMEYCRLVSDEPSD